MIQECKNPIVEDDFHGFLHRNCEGTEQLRMENTFMYKAGIFDLDGTLADTVDSMAYSANCALRRLGLPEQPTERFKIFAGDGAKELIRRCLRASGDETCSRFEEMQRLYRMYFSENCMYHVRPYDEILPLLERMKRQGMKLAVLSNKPHAQAVDVVERLFGKAYFDYVQGQTEEIPRKPNPAGALHIAEYFGVKRSECLYIGDTDTDMRTGKAAGMFTVGVLWGFRTREELEENDADWIAGRPLEIEPLVTEHL